MGRNLESQLARVHKDANKRCNILLQGKKLISTNVDLVTGLEGSSDNTVLGLDGEVDLVDRAKDFIDLADLGL